MAALAELTDTISVAADAISTNFELQQQIARLFDRNHSSVQRILAETAGLTPWRAARRRPRPGG